MKAVTTKAMTAETAAINSALTRTVAAMPMAGVAANRTMTGRNLPSEGRDKA